MSSIEDDFNCDEAPLDIDNETSEETTKDSFACEICDTNMNLTDFVKHVIEKHFKVSWLFSRFPIIRPQGDWSS